jgi:3-methylornithyl-N6-L-lysine dehydrogenase
MTRLREEDLHASAADLLEYDRHLNRILGVSLRQLAIRAAGADEASVREVSSRARIAVVPVTSGLGAIRGFSGAVASIVSHIGFDAFVPGACDVAGIAEGIERGANILMLADDHRFIAVSPGRRQVVDNSRATARGFVTGLELMAGELAGQWTLVLGCGRVGVAATMALLDRGAKVALCDLQPERVQAILENLEPAARDKITIEESYRTALERYRLILDATDTGSFIAPGHVTPQTRVAAPGMPCALTPDAMEACRDRVLNDALEIGTATMAVQAVVNLAASEQAKNGRNP